MPWPEIGASFAAYGNPMTIHVTSQFDVEIITTSRRQQSARVSRKYRANKVSFSARPRIYCVVSKSARNVNAVRPPINLSELLDAKMFILLERQLFLLSLSLLFAEL